MKKYIIPMKKVIFFNEQFVYFLRGKLVFRGRVVRRKGKTSRTGMESRLDKRVHHYSIRRVDWISRSCSNKLIEALKKFGVKVV